MWILVPCSTLVQREGLTEGGLEKTLGKSIKQLERGRSIFDYFLVGPLSAIGLNDAEHCDHLHL